MSSTTHAQMTVCPVFRAVMAAATATKTIPASSGPGLSNSESINAARIDGDISWSGTPRLLASSIDGAHVVVWSVLLSGADEVFLREHRYRGVVFRNQVRKSAR